MYVISPQLHRQILHQIIDPNVLQKVFYRLGQYKNNHLHSSIKYFKGQNR